MENEIYGWIYDKSGNVKEVYPPINEDGKPFEKPTNTSSGSLPDSVGG